MQTLNLPFYPFKLREQTGKLYIFDEIRRKYIILSPEEWVRQHLIQFLVLEKNYPKGLIRVESGLVLYTLRKRSDILILDRNGNNLLLGECKAPGVKLSPMVLDQAARYNQTYLAPFIVISNGLQTLACRIDHRKRTYEVLDEVPSFSSSLWPDY